MTSTTQQAYDLAQATGKIVVLGAKPFDKRWFAHCDGTEAEGSTPAQALRGLKHQMKEDLVRKRTGHAAQLAEVEALLTSLE